MAARRGGAVSYERGTPAADARTMDDLLSAARPASPDAGPSLEQAWWRSLVAEAREGLSERRPELTGRFDQLLPSGWMYK